MTYNSRGERLIDNFIFLIVHKRFLISGDIMLNFYIFGEVANTDRLLQDAA